MNATIPQRTPSLATVTVPLPFVPNDLAWSDDGTAIVADGLAAVNVGTGGLMWPGSGGGTFLDGQVEVAGADLIAFLGGSRGSLGGSGGLLRAASVQTGAELWRREDLYGWMTVDVGSRRIGINTMSAYHLIDLTTHMDIGKIPIASFQPPFRPAFSPAGTQWAIAGPRSIVIADTTGAIMHQIAVSSQPLAARFDDAGSTLTFVDRDARATVIDTASGAQISQSALDGLDSIPPAGSILDEQRPVALSPDGRIVAVVTAADISLFLASTGQCLGTVPTGGNLTYITSVVFSPDARTVAVTHIDGTTGAVSTAAKLIAAPVPRLLWEQSAAVLSGPAFSRTGRLAVAHGANSALAGVIDIVDTGAVLMLTEGSGADAAVLGVAMAGAGIRLVAVICADQAARLYAVDGGRLLYERAHPGPLADVAFLRGGQSFATACSDGRVRLFDTVTGEQPWFQQYAGPVNALACPPAGDFICAAGGDKTVRCLDAATGAQRWQAPFPQAVTRVIVSPDGAFAVAACADRTARLLHAADGGQAWQVQHDAHIRGLAVSPDATLVATASQDGIVRVLASGSGAVVREVSHVQGATSVAFSADGQSVISGSLDGAVLASPVADPAAPPAPLIRATAPVRQIGSGPGRSVAVASDDGLVRVVDLDLRTDLARIWSTAPVNDFAIDTAAGLLATGSADGTIRVDTWESR